MLTWLCEGNYYFPSFKSWGRFWDLFELRGFIAMHLFDHLLEFIHFDEIVPKFFIVFVFFRSLTRFCRTGRRKAGTCVNRTSFRFSGLFIIIFLFVRGSFSCLPQLIKSRQFNSIRIVNFFFPFEFLLFLSRLSVLLIPFGYVLPDTS